jgi:hypothetical protein
MSNDYEKQEMKAPGKELYRGKLASRQLAFVLMTMTLAMVALGLGLVFGGLEPNAPLLAKMAPFAIAAATLYQTLTKSVVRTLVTSDEVLIRWGLRGPRIPIQAITACKVIPYTKQHTAGATNYSPGGAGITDLEDRAVLLAWTDGDGKQQKAVIGDTRPAALAESIQRARVAHTGLRIGTDLATEDALAEAEALAIEEAAAMEKVARRSVDDH